MHIHRLQTIGTDSDTHAQRLKLMHTDSQTHTHTDSQTSMDTDSQTRMHMHAYIYIDTQAHRSLCPSTANDSDRRNN